ncbi:hypothetical protein D3C80_1450120 [compost metagenome]
MAVQAVAQLAPFGGQGDGQRLPGRAVQPQDVADILDLKGVELAAALDDDAHVRLAHRARLKTQAAAHVDGGDDPSAQVQRPRHLERGQGHAVDPHRGDHVLNPQQGNADHLITDTDGHEAFQRGLGRGGIHAAS